MPIKGIFSKSLAENRKPSCTGVARKWAKVVMGVDIESMSPMVQSSREALRRGELDCFAALAMTEGLAMTQEFI
jgi:hypothetical protein